MAAVKNKVFQSALRIYNSSSFRWPKVSSTRFYSVYPPDYVEPINDKTIIDKAVKEKQKEEILGLKVRPAPNNHTCSMLYHPDVERFINYTMSDGKRHIAAEVIKDAFRRVKHIQLRKYNAETNPEIKETIIINPLEMFLLAVKNITPLLWTLKIKRSGTWYKVPVGISEEKAKGRAMKWLLEVANDRDKKIPLKVQLAYEIVAAANYEGRAIAKKIELHKLCETNRGYVNYWWT